MRTKNVVRLMTGDGPASEHCCFLCGRPVRPQSRRWGHFIAGGCEILHPDDELLYTPDPGDLGAHVVGPECARRIGDDFLTRG